MIEKIRNLFRQTIQRQESFSTSGERRENKKPGQDIDEWIGQLFGICNDAIFIHPITHERFGRFIKVNDIACHQLGYTREELLDLSPYEIGAEGTAEVRDHVFKTLSQMGHMVFEIDHIRKDGSRIPVEVSSRVYQLGGQSFVFSLVRDLSDRKHIENELRESQTLLETIFEHSPHSMWVSDENGVMLRMNQACRDLLGITDEDVVGKYNVLKDEIVIQQGLMHFVERVFEKGEKVQFPLEYDCSYLHKVPGPDYPKVILEVTIAPVLNERKQVIHAIILHRDITDRKHAEDALREAEQKYRLLVENSQSIIYTVTADGTMTFVSPSWKTLLGYAYEEAAGKNFRPFIHPDDVAMCEEYLRKTAETGMVHSGVEYRVIHKDGSIRWHRSVISPAFDERHNLILFVGNAVDITERKQAEEALEKRMISLLRPLDSSEGITFDDLFNIQDIQRLQDEFSDATGVASIITHTDGTPITEPSNFCHLCSGIIRNTEVGRANCYRSDATLGRACVDGPTVQPCLSGGLWDAGAGITVGGRHIANWLIGQVRDETQTEEKMRAYAREIGANENAFIEAFREVPSMSRARFEKISQALFSFANQLSKSAYQNVQQARFITERKQVEEELRKLAAIVQNSKEVVNLASLDGRMVFLNQVGCNVLGIDPNSVQQFCIMDVIADPFKNIVEQEVLPNLLKGGHWQGELQLCNLQTGKLVDVFSTSFSIIDPATGVPQFLANVSLDITERKRAEEEQAKLKEQLNQSQKIESVGRLAGGVAHDFNNMLGVILGHADMALDRVDPSQPIYNDLKEIQKAAEHSADLTRQLLAFARKQTAAPRVLDLNTTVEGILKMLRRLIGEAINLVWIPDRNLGSVKVDPSQVDQILANLCVNARDAINETGTITIQTDTVTFDEAYCATHEEVAPGIYVRLTVSDNGCGMNSESLSRLFEPFYTTKAMGKGTGLGLATVYGIVKQNLGYITVSSEVGKGTAFRVHFPQFGATPIPQIEVHSSRHAILGHETILLVEDESMILEMAAAMLEHQGYTVLAASTPDEAVQLAAAYAGQVDLLITDVIMPGMNGRELSNSLLSLYPRLKRLFMSGYTADVIAHHGVLEEGVHFIQKPFTMMALTDKVREVLDEEVH